MTDEEKIHELIGKNKELTLQLHDEQARCNKLLRENILLKEEVEKLIESNFDEKMFEKAVEVANEYDNLKKENEKLKEEVEKLHKLPRHDLNYIQQDEYISCLEEQYEEAEEKIEQMKCCANCMDRDTCTKSENWFNKCDEWKFIEGNNIDINNKAENFRNELVELCKKYNLDFYAGYIDAGDDDNNFIVEDKITHKRRYIDVIELDEEK